MVARKMIPTMSARATAGMDNQLMANLSNSNHTVVSSNQAMRQVTVASGNSMVRLHQDMHRATVGAMTPLVLRMYTLEAVETAKGMAVIQMTTKERNTANTTEATECLIMFKLNEQPICRI